MCLPARLPRAGSDKDITLAARRVTLTFDNGPTPGITGRVLDILARTGIRSTFFVLGKNLGDAEAASLAREAHAAGHWIGNHTMTHSVALGDNPDADYATREIGETQDRIGPLSHPDKLFRPFGNSGQIGPHLLSKAALAYLLAHRFRTIIWNSIPGDWRDPDGWVDAAVAQVAAQDWSVVVLHDMANGCLPRLPEFFARLADLDVVYAQDFPDEVTLTRGGRPVSLSPDHLSD
jgi:peptidoglycan-N-acetylglucosamine deacetylase